MRYGKCALCGKETNLENSHIIPKFVSKRIVKKSATGFMRNLFSPQRRIQDGSKEYLLCGDCEDRFNIYETVFASKVFNPYKNGKLEDFEYGDWLSKFIVSVNWRTLYLDLIEYVKNQNIGIDELNCFIECESILRKFLLDEIKDIGTINIDMFIFNDISSASQEIIDCDPHSFFYGSLFDYTTIVQTERGKCLGIVANLSGLIIYTTLYRTQEYKSENTSVELHNGEFKVCKQSSESPILEDVFLYMIESRKKEIKLSGKEKDKIIKILDENPEKLTESESYKNLKKDDNLKHK